VEKIFGFFIKLCGSWYFTLLSIVLNFVVCSKKKKKKMKKKKLCSYKIQGKSILERDVQSFEKFQGQIVQKF